jgi:2'-5' RNA ligase
LHEKNICGLAKINLIKKPDCLDSYRKKYNNLYEHHVTLKQPCFIDDTEMPDISSIVSKVFSEFAFPNHKIDVEFEEVVADREDKSIMLLAEKNELLMKLQYKIKTALGEYSNYCEPETQEYETNFKPHLTITGEVGEKFDEALKDVGKDTRCVGEITEIILSCVEENTIKEAKDPKNLAVYKL